MFDVCLPRVLSYEVYLFMSDGIDKHMSEPFVIKNTDVFPAVLL